MENSSLYIQLNKKSNKQIVRLLALEKKKYSSEALEVARHILKSRDLQSSEVKSLKREIRNDLKKERDNQKSSSNWSLDLLLEFVFNGLLEFISLLFFKV